MARSSSSTTANDKERPRCYCSLCAESNGLVVGQEMDAVFETPSASVAFNGHSMQWSSSSSTRSTFMRVHYKARDSFISSVMVFCNITFFCKQNTAPQSEQYHCIVQQRVLPRVKTRGNRTYRSLAIESEIGVINNNDYHPHRNRRAEVNHGIISK